jgi:hypothetical protein
MPFCSCDVTRGFCTSTSPIFMNNEEVFYITHCFKPSNITRIILYNEIFLFTMPSLSLYLNFEPFFLLDVAVTFVWQLHKLLNYIILVQLIILLHAFSSFVYSHLFKNFSPYFFFTLNFSSVFISFSYSVCKSKFYFPVLFRLWDTVIYRLRFWTEMSLLIIIYYNILH